jgi:hypothetical protein
MILPSQSPALSGQPVQAGLPMGKGVLDEVVDQWACIGCIVSFGEANVGSSCCRFCLLLWLAWLATSEFLGARQDIGMGLYIFF